MKSSSLDRIEIFSVFYIWVLTFLLFFEFYISNPTQFKQMGFNLICFFIIKKWSCFDLVEVMIFVILIAIRAHDWMILSFLCITKAWVTVKSHPPFCFLNFNLRALLCVSIYVHRDIMNLNNKWCFLSWVESDRWFHFLWIFISIFRLSFFLFHILNHTQFKQLGQNWIRFCFSQWAWFELLLFIFLVVGNFWCSHWFC